MGLVYLPTWNMFENFIKAIRTFLKDFERLASEQRQLFDSYVKNATPRNPDLYLSRAKHIEECLLLGVTAEFLLKAVLLKHSYILNLEIAQRQKRFDPDFFKRIMDFNSKDPLNTLLGHRLPTPIIHIHPSEKERLVSALCFPISTMLYGLSKLK